MNYIIFTHDGLEQARDEIIAGHASLWLNPDVLAETERTKWTSQGIKLHILPHQVNAESEKAVLAALDYVEKHVAKGEEIFIEYL